MTATVTFSAQDLALLAQALDHFEDAVGKIGADLFGVNGGKLDLRIAELQRHVVGLKFEIDEQRMALVVAGEKP